MAQTQLGFFARLWLAITIPWRLLFDATLGTGMAEFLHGISKAANPVKPLDYQATSGAVLELDPIQEPLKPKDTTGLQVLAILQREGRLIDFLQEDVTHFSDEEVGAAARVVHEGCNRGLNHHVVFEPVRNEEEGASIDLVEGFDAHRLRLTGNVVGKPPFQGRLAHHGWQVKNLELPTLSPEHDPWVLSPAEIEIE